MKSLSGVVNVFLSFISFLLKIVLLDWFNKWRGKNCEEKQ